MTAFGLRSFWNGRQLARPELIAVVGFESGLGLLAVAVGAASAWAAERAAGRGALDVLLATPMSAALIIRGKWWASYRPVLCVAALPAFAVVVLAAGAPTWPSFPLGAVPPVAAVPLRTIDRVMVAMVVIGQVLVYGAAVVSLGLWLATRLARPTWAVVAAVVAFGMVGLVWPTVEEIFLMRQIDRNLNEGLAALSPFAGPIVTQMSMFSPWFGTARGVVPYATGWLVVAVIFAASLRWWTIRTFDHHMGRMSAPVERQEHGHAPPSRDSARWGLSRRPSEKSG